MRIKSCCKSFKSRSDRMFIFLIEEIAWRTQLSRSSTHNFDRTPTEHSMVTLSTLLSTGNASTVIDDPLVADAFAFAFAARLLLFGPVFSLPPRVPRLPPLADLEPEVTTLPDMHVNSRLTSGFLFTVSNIQLFSPLSSRSGT